MITSTSTMSDVDSPTTGMDDGGFRFVILPTLEEADSTSSESDPEDNYRLDVHKQLPVGRYELDSGYEPDVHHELEAPIPQPDLPTHPIPSLQAAFEESLREVTNGGAIDKPKLGDIDHNVRRGRLLEQGREDPAFDTTWRYRPGQRQHEVEKLVAQIIFGVYLLDNGLANDNTQVIGILQGHIDEVDEFLEVVLQDMALAVTDMYARIEELRMSLSNMDALGEKLEEPEFRAEMIDRNEKVDHILSRTNVAMKQWDDDVDAGLRCSTSFHGWLVSTKDNPSRAERPQMMEIYEAMKGNAEGWLHAFDEMNSRVQTITEVYIRLMTTLGEMQKKTGEVTQQAWPTSPRFNLANQQRKLSQSGVPQDSLSPSTAAMAQKVFPLSRSPGSLRSVHSLRKSPNRQTSVRSISSTTRPRMRSDSSATRQSNMPRLNRSGSISTVMAIEVGGELDNDADGFNIEDLNEFPLPGSMPLLPPTNVSKQLDYKASQVQMRPKIDTSEKMLQVETHEDGKPSDDMYILQPRTYTPVLPSAPMSPPLTPMTPFLRDAVKLAAQMEVQRQSALPVQKSEPDQPIQKKQSLRQRVSVKTNLPEAIHIPSAGETLARRSRAGLTSPSTATSQAFDAVYAAEQIPIHRPPMRMVSQSDMSHHLPQKSPTRSEQQQFYRPVMASPHSPLQQRPHTAVPHESVYRPSASYPQYLRTQPSRLGGMSMLSTVAASTYEDGRNAGAPTIRTQGTSKSLKKKKSALGWLKKAFSMDEEEKAAYEARKAQRFTQAQPQDQFSPKFVDGRRVR
jgi:hypothetical protein